MKIHRSIDVSIRTGGSWEDRWEGPDCGLVACWEAGRELAIREPELARLATLGQLPILPWRGGVEKATKGPKFGSYYYLAMLQGLRNQDLDVDLATEVKLVCAMTGMAVTFTSNREKYAEA